jgi:hypothetical protein
MELFQLMEHKIPFNLADTFCTVAQTRLWMLGAGSIPLIGLIFFGNVSIGMFQILKKSKVIQLGIPIWEHSICFL